MLHYAVYQKNSAIVYTLKKRVRMVFLLITLFLLWGLVLNIGEGVSIRSMIHIVLLLIVTTIGVLYRDGWTFDVGNRTIRSWWGIGPWVKRESFRFDEVVRLDLAHFIKGSASDGKILPKRRQKAVVVFSIILTDERQKTVQVIPERSSSGRIEAAFDRIAIFTELPAKIDRPRDVNLPLRMKDL
ncbi:MAG: hypothetical protein ACOX0D_06975 [Sphaerochaeta sp.]|jgi:hypothetical protein